MSRSTEAVQARAEILKLARALDRDPASFHYLEELAAEDLRALRHQVIEVLWSADGAALGKLAAASKLLPAGVNATISERALGPIITAQLAGRLDPARAVDVAAKLSTPFLADVAIALDPRRTSAVIAGMPPRRIAEITAELVRRGEYVTMGQFVGHLGDEAIRAALGAMDNADLLQVGFVLEDKARLDRLIALLPPGRLDGIITAAVEGDLWLEALDLLAQLSAGRRRRIIAQARTFDEATLDRIVAAVLEHDLWEEAELIAQADPGLQLRLTACTPRSGTAANCRR